MQLLKYFHELSLHPANAKRLKGLILQLALRGRLTKSFREENISTVKANIIDGYYDLPNGWYWEIFDNVCDFNMGKTPPSKQMEYWEGNIPWISIADMTTYGYIRETKKSINDLALKKYFRNSLVKKGTLLLSFKLSIGKTSIMDIDGCHNEAIISIYPNDIVTKEFLFLFLPIISNWGTQVAALKGNTLNKEKLQNLKIPLPPLEEQKAIVETVDRLFKEVEQLEQLTESRIRIKEQFVLSALRRLAENNTPQEWVALQPHFHSFFNHTPNIKKLRETILQLAVQGKLTARWRKMRAGFSISGEMSEGQRGKEDDDAALLLQKIKAEKTRLIAEGKIKKENPLPEITPEEIPYELPEGWVWCRLGEIVIKLGAGSTPLGGKNYYLEDGIKFLRSQNVYNEGLRLQEVAFITEETHQKMSGTHVHPQDLLLNITGASIGRCALVPDDFDTANVSQHVSIIRLVYKSLRKYIHSLIISRQFQQTIMNVQVGVSREGLSMTKLKYFLIPLPPLSEQQAIVSTVNRLMALCDSLEQEVASGTARAELWMKGAVREVMNF